MTEQEPSKFKMRRDDNPESQFHSDTHDIRIEKLNQRMTWIAIIIPCLIGVILYFIYRDIQMRVGQVSDTETTKVQTLSKDLETRFASLSDKQRQLQQDIGALEKTSAGLQKNLKSALTAIRYIREARTIDNKNMDNAITAINKSLTTLTPIPEQLETMAADIKVSDQKFSKEMKNFSQSLDGVKNDLIKIQADIISLSSLKIDGAALNKALKKQEQKFQNQLQQTRRDMDDKIAGMENKLKVLNPGTASPAKAVRSPSPKTSTSAAHPSKADLTQPPASKTTSPKTDSPEKPIKKTEISTPVKVETPPKQTTLPKPGTFIEQDIK